MKTRTRSANYKAPKTVYTAHVVKRETGEILESFNVNGINRTESQRVAHVMPQTVKYSKGFLDGSLYIKLERVSPRFI